MKSERWVPPKNLWVDEKWEVGTPLETWVDEKWEVGTPLKIWVGEKWEVGTSLNTWVDESERWAPLWVDADSKKCQICIVQMAKKHGTLFLSYSLSTQGGAHL